jgi:hypothetical protein
MMLPTYYLLQVIICSGILFLYYHLALRNGLFHQWNRFYLLFAVVLSLALPAIDWDLEKPDDVVPVSGLVTAITDVRSSMEIVAIEPESRLSFKDLIVPVYILISAAFLIFLVFSLVKLIQSIRTQRSTRIGRVHFVDSNAPGTPFSFFQFIFWNKEIDIQSETGKRIVRHEMVHVQEWHSADKLFMQLILAIFWINPFYWLIRRELRSVHEFIADKHATGEEGGAALAAMILESSFYRSSSFITNQFFNTSIKRRIAMITKPHPKVNYFTRVLALPVIALIAFTFTVRSQTADNVKQTTPPGTTTAISPEAVIRDGVAPVYPVKDTVPHSGKPTRVDFLKDGKAIVYFKTGFEIMTWDDAVKKKYITAAAADQQKKALKKNEDPLIVFNGEVKVEHTERSSEIFRIEGAHVTVLKPEEAVVKYGDRGKNGAVEITGALSDRESEPVFVKVEKGATIDDVVWRNFIHENLSLVLKEVESKVKPGKYTVVMQMLIEPDGTVSQVGTVYDDELKISELLVPMLMKSPQWKPAMQNGKKVRSYVKQPITFVIEPKSTQVGSTLPYYTPEQMKKMTYHELLGVKESDIVISCNIAMDLPNEDIIEVRNEGNELTGAAKKLIDQAEKGLMITVDAILIKKEDGTAKKIPAKVYRM